MTTNRADFAESLRRFRNHGILTDARQRNASGQWHYEMVLLGFNYRLTDVACALGLSQLKNLEANLVRRREIAARYTAAFWDLPGVVPPSVRDDVKPAWLLYPIPVDAAKLNADRDRLFRDLRSENIGVNVHHMPVHLHLYCRNLFGYKGGEYPVAERAYEQLISLPMFHGMTEQDVEDVLSAVRKVTSHYSR